MKSCIKELTGMFAAAVLIMGITACQQEVDSHEHTWSKDWSSDTESHWHAPLCDDTTELKDKADHSFPEEWTVVTEATEEAEGLKHRFCTVCNYEATQVIAKLEHTHKYSEEWSTDDTYHWHEAICGDTEEVSGKAEHDWGSGVVTKKATVTSEGELTYTCICGKTKTATIAKLICDHNWGSGVVTTAATCTTAGVRTYTCSACGETKTEEIAATGHIWNGIVTTAATCTTKGTKSYKCTVCGEVARTEEIPAIGHTEDSGTVIAPTCVTKGSTVYKCTVCGKITKSENYVNELYSSPIDVSTGKAATSSSKYIYFGVFPKTVAYKDDAGKLYAADKTTEITIDETTSVSMGGNTYYKGSDGEYYAKVTENAYTTGYKYNDGTTVNKSSVNSTRYFKLEPIKWKVLTADYNSTGKALLLAEESLTANVPYYYSYLGTRSVGTDTTIYPNNYKYSQIRAYLNGLDYYNDSNTTVSDYSNKGFLQTAFTTAAQSLIATTTVVNNDLSTTDATGALTRATDYTCADTQDKIFLLSEQEVTTADYGFAAYNVYKGVSGTTESSRIRVTTDYAKANYASSTDGCDYWWLRSPHYYNNNIFFARCINRNGRADDSDTVHNTNYGVVPALSISLQ